MCMTVFPRTNRLNFPFHPHFFFVIALPSTKTSLNLFLQLSFRLYRFYHPRHNTHIPTRTLTHIECWIRNRQRKRPLKKEREVDCPVFMTSTDKNPKRGRSIGFDSTRDCACLPLVGRTYVGTYVLCIRIYIHVYKKYIYYIYILYFRISVYLARHSACGGKRDLL